MQKPIEDCRPEIQAAYKALSGGDLTWVPINSCALRHTMEQEDLEITVFWESMKKKYVVSLSVVHKLQEYWSGTRISTTVTSPGNLPNAILTRLLDADTLEDIRDSVKQAKESYAYFRKEEEARQKIADLGWPIFVDGDQYLYTNHHHLECGNYRTLLKVCEFIRERQEEFRDYLKKGG